MQICTPEDFLYNLQAFTSNEATKLWRQHIKDSWDNRCAYCGSKEELTIDHIIPQTRGGNNHITNVLCCCKKCNGSKSHYEWNDWYNRQEFFSQARRQKIEEWITAGQRDTNRVPYGKRKNNAINYQVKVA